MVLQASPLSPLLYQTTSYSLSQMLSVHPAVDLPSGRIALSDIVSLDLFLRD
eukprot:CAMPEP_0194432412 /NCGR_PEP_ID=MMETSP0176-20130528/70309_1 /TAXON_ID=216777 /ORGANISM="Proboscia alata, Strain PI-D3" /LENGTH=51 /DNA_ID=CAMNT_0039248649 /DNA_START=398 /DNA_END=553 /DNA_ORIENTATION=+